MTVASLCYIRLLLYFNNHISLLRNPFPNICRSASGEDIDKVGNDVEDDEVGVVKKDDAGGPPTGPDEFILLVTCT